MYIVSWIRRPKLNLLFTCVLTLLFFFSIQFQFQSPTGVDHNLTYNFQIQANASNGSSACLVHTILYSFSTMFNIHNWVCSFNMEVGMDGNGPELMAFLWQIS